MVTKVILLLMTSQSRQALVLDKVIMSQFYLINEIDVDMLNVKMSRVERKPFLWVSDQVRHKLGCTARGDDSGFRN